MTLDELVNQEEEAFRSIVDDEVRGHLDPETAALLRDPKVVDRWFLALIVMKKSVESQMAAKRDDLARFAGSHQEETERLAFRKWRAGALRFRNGVEDRILEIRAIRWRNGATISTDPYDAIVLNADLASAIRTHRKKMLEDYEPDEVSDADRQLWRLLDQAV